MIMKDKLYKTNHKAFYYRTRKFLITSAVVLSAFTAIGVPTYINYKNEKRIEREALKERVEIEAEKTDLAEVVERFEGIDIEICELSKDGPEFIYCTINK